MLTAPAFSGRPRRRGAKRTISVAVARAWMSPTRRWLAVKGAFAYFSRLANHGYVVLVPDLFYRAGPYEPVEPRLVFESGDVSGAIGHLLASTDNQRAAADTAAFLAYLDTRDDVIGPRVGTTGYCMGGAISLTAAGTYPERIAAAASFHGGNLATDSELSPHRLAPQISARV